MYRVDIFNTHLLLQSVRWSAAQLFSESRTSHISTLTMAKLVWRCIDAQRGELLMLVMWHIGLSFFPSEAEGATYLLIGTLESYVYTLEYWVEYNHIHVQFVCTIVCSIPTGS